MFYTQILVNFSTGSALYQIQNGKQNVIADVSERLPEAAQNYSTTELEMCCLVINIASFVHLLKRVDFEVIVHHLALTHITTPQTCIFSEPKLHILLN